MLDLLKSIVEIHREQVKARKALELLKKQEWSVDFLTALIVKAAKANGSPLELTVTSPNGIQLKVNSYNQVKDNLRDDDDIFMHLDDEAAINDFIRRHGK